MKKIMKVDPRIKVKNHPDLVEQPVVIRVTEFNEKSASSFCDEISKAHSTGQPIIPIIVDSYGGEVHALLTMVSEIEHSDLPIATICTGKAMSCGAVLLTCGAEGHRYIDPNATVMIHDVSAGQWGKVAEIKAAAEETQRLHKMIFTMMDKNCGQEAGYFESIVHEKAHAEWFLTPKEAKKHNIINHIKIPSFRTNVTVEVEFG
jgi:ATP-dependent Clp protease protease subunit